MVLFVKIGSISSVKIRNTTQYHKENCPHIIIEKEQESTIWKSAVDLCMSFRMVIPYIC